MPKTRNGYETLMLVPAYEINGVPWMVTPTGLIDFSAPTAAALNVYQGITTPSQTNAPQGGNISCAIQDDIDLGLTGSDTDDAKTLCSKGNTADLTYYNFDANINSKRDASVTGNSQENLFRDLTRQPDVPYFIVHRVRGEKDSTETFAVGDEVDIYYVYTDIQVTSFGDGEPIQAQVAFIPKSIINVGYVLTA